METTGVSGLDTKRSLCCRYSNHTLVYGRSDTPNVLSLLVCIQSSLNIDSNTALHSPCTRYMSQFLHSFIHVRHRPSPKPKSNFPTPILSPFHSFSATAQDHPSMHTTQKASKQPTACVPSSIHPSIPLLHQSNFTISTSSSSLRLSSPGYCPFASFASFVSVFVVCISTSLVLLIHSERCF